jgi:hypothetical protein
MEALKASLAKGSKSAEKKEPAGKAERPAKKKAAGGR